MLSCRLMRVCALVAPLLAALLLACGGAQTEPDHRAEWRDVLEHKKAAKSAAATAEHKQVYADSVRAFVQKHPNHGRAQEVWAEMQLQFADDLAAVGRHQEAIRFYRAVLAQHPENDRARSGLALAADRLAVTREKLLALQKGMTHRQVEHLLGKPMPGWSVKHRRAGATMEAWYYPARGGGVAAVYFRDSRVLAAEESSHAQLGRLGS